MLQAHRFALALGLAALAAPSFAATTYTSSASFFDNVALGAYTETFDGLGSTPPSTFTSGGFSYDVSAASGLYGSGAFLGTNLPNEALTLTFTTGNVSAVGANFYATNLSNAFQSVALTVALSDGTSVTYTPTSVGSYLGFTSSFIITSLTISAPAASLYAGLDNLTVGVAAVPEPASALLMALGAASLLIVRRRKI